MPWSPLPLSYAIAVYPFQPSSSSELPLQIGDQLYVIEHGGPNDSWCRGYLVAPPSLLSALSPDGRAVAEARVFSGIFPKCFIEIREELGSLASHRASAVSAPGISKPQAPVPMLKIGDESPTSSSEPLVDEISSCLREWYILHLPDLVLKREYGLLENTSAITTRLDYARRELLNDVLTVRERMSVRDQAVWDLVRGNKMLSGEVIVRDPKHQGRLLTSEDSVIQVAKLQSMMTILDHPPVEKVETTSLHHCLLEVKSVTGANLDSAMLNISLYQKKADGSFSPFSETFSCPAIEKSKTLFADLNMRDIGADDQLYLIVKLVTAESPKKPVKPSPEIPLTRNGTIRSNKDMILNRRRSSLMFGSKRKSERPTMGANGKFTSSIRERAPTPSIQEEPDDDRSSSQSQGPPIPRTVGVGVFDAAKAIRSGEEFSTTVTIWTSSKRDDEAAEDVNPTIPALLNNSSQSYVLSEKVSRAELVLTPFTSPDAETLIRNNPTSMYEVSKTQKMGFSEAPTKPRTDIYLILSKAVIPQRAQLSHPTSGFVPMKQGPLLNLQLTMEVRDAAGRRIEHCIKPSSNSPGATAYRTNATELGESWDQILCLRIPTEKVAESHLIISVADAPEFPFALAWIPLWDKQAFVPDGNHSLILHAYDKTTSSIIGGRGAYLSLPWDNAAAASGHDGVTTTVATLELETRLCSTEYSQDRILVSLINWKQQSSVQLQDILQKLIFVPEIEIVKQLRDVLDSLFDVLVYKSGESRFEDLIFNDIVFVLGIVHDRRYNLGPLIEQYAESDFDSPQSAACLVRSLTRLLQSVSHPQSARDLRALFKVGKQFMKLLVASYQQSRTPLPGQQPGKQAWTFQEDMEAVLFGLQMMMRSETPALIGSKTLLIQNFHTWLPELLPAFSKDDVIKVAINFVDSSEEATGKLVLYRILLILNYIKLDQLWIDPKDRNLLVKNCLRWLTPYWTINDLTEDWREQTRLCCSVVAELCHQPTPMLHDFLPKIVNAYCYLAIEPPVKKRVLSLLFSTSYPFPVKTGETSHQFDEALLELSALAITISKTKAPATLKFQDQDVSTYILSTLSLLRSLLNNDAYPSTWLSLHIHNHASILDILTNIATLLTNTFLPAPEDSEEFDMQLWKVYFETLLALVSSPSLTLESFPEQKRRVVWKIAGDVRQAGADLLRRSWESLGWETTDDDQRRYNIRKLGGFQVQYVPSLVMPIIELCLSMHEGLRKVAVEILQTMIISEWALSENLDLIETEMIGALNTVLKTKNIGVNEAMSRKLFITELTELFSTIANQPDDALWATLEELIGTIEELINLLTNADNDDEEVAGEMAKARRSIDNVSGAREGREYGVHALECYKQLADEYEKSGDYKRLAKTHRAIARIHEARAASRLGGAMNGHKTDGEEDVEEE